MSAPDLSTTLWQVLLMDDKWWHMQIAREQATELWRRPQYRKMSDLWLGVLFGVVLTLVRVVLDKLFFARLARYLLPEYVVKDEMMKIPPNSVLELEFGRDPHPSSSRCHELAKQSGLPSANEVALWFKQRMHQKLAAGKVAKFCECLWRCSYYWSVVFFGLYVVYDKPWATDNDYLFHQWPDHPVSSELKYYYMVSLGYYFHSIVALFFEQRKSDFWQMMLHHIATMALIMISWWMSLFRIGCVILLLHDIADPWMELAKMANYTGRHAKLCDAFFVIFTLAFGVTRLIFYPLFALEAVIYKALPHPSLGLFFCGQCTQFGAYAVFVVLLLLLQVLHIMWYYLILRIAYQAVVYGGVQKDVRSDSDISDAEDSNPREGKKEK